MKISIIGLGWFGEALAQELKTDHEVMGTTRSDEKVLALKKQNILAEKLTISETPSEKMLAADVIILNIPPFQDQLAWFKSWKWNQSTHVIFISSTSVYGKNTGTADETTLPVPENENGKILIDEENWIKSFPHFTIVRFAGLIGPGRHPGKSLSGRKNISGGNSPVNLIQQDDTIGFIKTILKTKSKNETYNLVNPEHPTRADFYINYCRVNQLPLPEFSLQEVPFKTVSSQKVSSLYEINSKLSIS